MYLFRIHIRPSGGTADIKMTFSYCLKNKLLGCGWRTDSNKNTKDWEEYLKEAEPKHGKLQICRYIQKWVSKDDLVWTRDTGGMYYLAKVRSGWEYWVSPEGKENDIDIANIFRVDFQKVHIDEVPGRVVASFRSPRTIQEVTCKKALAYSKYLWNKLAGEEVYRIDKSDFSDIFMMLDDEETEDLVFLYLQSQGWYVVPNSRKADTMSFEYLAINKKTKKRALTQVKTGDVSLNQDEYRDYEETIFLFQEKELYEGSGGENVICLRKKELLGFLEDSIDWLPQSFQNKNKMRK